MSGGKESRGKDAVDLFLQGFSCSQAVLTSFCDIYGLDRETSLKISQPFGGGIAHTGQMCGAVTGALLVIGLEFGRTRVEDEEAKEKTYDAVQQFMDQFKAQHDSLVCRELLGHDINDPDDLEKIREKDLFSRLCPRFVETAVAILENLIPASSPKD
jgi:C_GCAxxG_C_C family probable redox protein